MRNDIEALHFDLHNGQESQALFEVFGAHITEALLARTDFRRTLNLGYGKFPCIGRARFAIREEKAREALSRIEEALGKA